MGPSTSTPIVAGGVKLKELKNRLQTASEGSVGKTVVEKKEKKGSPSTGIIIQKNPKWFQSRPFMSWDYPAPGNGSDPQQGPLGNLPIGDQERVLVEELLYILSGFDGDYIRTVPLHSEVDERRFEIDESNYLTCLLKQCITMYHDILSVTGADESLKEMVRRFFPILSAYSVIQRFYESRSGFNHGMVNDALASAIGHLVHDYRIFVCQLESLLLKGELSLQKAWYLMQPNVTMLHHMHHVTLSLMKAKAHGGQVKIITGIYPFDRF